MRRGFNKLFIEPGMKSGMAACGKHVKIASGCEIKPLKNVTFGSNVEIGPRALFWTTRANIIIGNHVIMGPHVTIITGDHVTNIVGKYIMDISDDMKPEDADADIEIEDDVWIGCNVTILKGVHVGKGAIIAAGAVVTGNVDEFSIYAGVPAKKIKDRFTADQLDQHKKGLEE